MKERGDDSGSSHEIIQTILDVCLKLCLGSWGLFCAGITLDITVEQFVGIIFWRVGWQEKQFDPILMLFHPGLNQFCVMHTQIVTQIPSN